MEPTISIAVGSLIGLIFLVAFLYFMFVWCAVENSKMKKLFYHFLEREGLEETYLEYKELKERVRKF